MSDPLASWRAIEAAARASHRKVFAFLSSRSRDLAACEDALADAFRAALERWPADGVPSAPEAWLLTVAKRRLLDAARREGTARAADAQLLAACEEAQLSSADSTFPDERLKLLFVCAHPAIDPDLHTPLMLQVVLGLDAARIGSAFLIAPKTMGQRLVRAKLKIRDAGIPFEVPGKDELSDRLTAVLSAIYAAYGSGRDVGVGEGARQLREEAVLLARLLLAFLPKEPEAWGLLALILHCEAREPARRSPQGAYVPLSEQPTGLWSQELLQEAEQCLERGSRYGRFGRFLFEAAIQSVHAQRAQTGKTDWPALVLLYAALLRVSPTIGAAVAQAAAVLEAHGASAALALLDALDPAAVNAYQPYWAVRANALLRAGRSVHARDAFTRAIGLADDPAVREFLLRKLEQLERV